MKLNFWLFIFSWITLIIYIKFRKKEQRNNYFFFEIPRIRYPSDILDEVIKDYSDENVYKYSSFNFKSDISNYFPLFKNTCDTVKTSKDSLVLILPGCNDRCIGIDYFVWELERNTESDILCVEYGYQLER